LFLVFTAGISHGSLASSVKAALTASHLEAVDLYSGRMYKLDLLKFDPLAYTLIAVVIALQIYSIFLRSPGGDAGAGRGRADPDRGAAVLDSVGARGVLQQLLRQNELERGLLEATLAACRR